MFIYMAIANEFMKKEYQLEFKIGFCYGVEKNKYRNVRYKEGFDIIKICPIQTRDVAGGVWIEHTVRELIKQQYPYRYKYIPNDRFCAHTSSYIFALYKELDKCVSKAQELYNELFLK